MDIKKTYKKKKDENLDPVNPNWDLLDIIKTIELTNEYDKINNDNYHKMRSFIYYDTVSEEEAGAIRKLNKPPLSFNSLEAYLSRLCGEMAKHLPSITLQMPASSIDISTAPQDVAQKLQMERKQELDKMDFAEGYIRNVFDYADTLDGFQNVSYQRTMSGAFNVAEVYTEYENEVDFYQNIRIKNSDDPTLYGFDPMAKAPHKGDGRYVYKKYPMEVSVFKEKYKDKFPNIDLDIENIRSFNEGQGATQWRLKNNKSDYIYVCDFYTKKRVPFVAYELADGSGIEKDKYADYKKTWEDQTHTPAPKPVGERDTFKEVICRTRLIKSKVLEYEETDFTGFPFVYIDGNKVDVKTSTTDIDTKEVRRPYFWQTIGMQRLKDRAGQTWAYMLENMVMSKWIVSMEAIPSEDPGILSAYKNNQVGSVILYHEVAQDNPNMKLNPPVPVQNVPMPPEVMQAFTYAEQAFQFMLGSYDSSLGINNNQLSGDAIKAGAIQSNAAAAPYQISHLQGITRIAELILGLIPKYLTHSRKIDIVNNKGEKASVGINDFGNNSVSIKDFDTRKIKVKIEAGVNSSIQKAQAIQNIQNLCQYIPKMSEFFGSQEGMPIIMDNLEFHGSDRAKENIPQFFAQQEQQQQQQMQMQQQMSQMSPDMIKAKAAMAKVQSENANKSEQNRLREQDIAVKSQSVKNDSAQILLNDQIEKRQQAIQNDKNETEKHNKNIDILLKTADMEHKHKIEKHNVMRDTANNIIDNLHKIKDNSSS